MEVIKFFQKSSYEPSLAYILSFYGKRYHSSINNRYNKMIKGTVKIEEEICKGCELCIVACPQGSLGLSSHINTHGYRYVELIKDNCTGCINCAIVCPEPAITVYRQSKTAKSKVA